MADLFERRCLVIVGKPPSDYVSLLPGAIEVTGLRMQFKISKTLTKTPNTCEVLITNLSEKSRAGMQEKGSRCIVQAGYPNTQAQIFSGDVRTIEHVRAGPDWVTKIQCGDGERSYKHGRVNDSFAAGTSIVDVLKSAARGLLIDPGNLSEKAATLTNQFVNGYAMQGKASREFDKVLEGTPFTWSIQDGRLQLLSAGEPNRDAVVELSPESGMVGSPEHGSPEKKGGPAMLKVKSLLQPTIKPGGRIRVRSAQHNGVFRVVKVEHNGDTAGGEWYTTVEAHAL